MLRAQQDGEADGQCASPVPRMRASSGPERPPSCQVIIAESNRKTVTKNPQAQIELPE